LRLRRTRKKSGRQAKRENGKANRVDTSHRNSRIVWDRRLLVLQCGDDAARSEMRGTRFVTDDVRIGASRPNPFAMRMASGGNAGYGEIVSCCPQATCELPKVLIRGS
jgi:hypothetical protein